MYRAILHIPLIIVLIGIAAFEGVAQQLDVKQYTTGDGLLSNDITIMTESSEGYLWFGTSENGLFWFDGFQSRQYAEAKGLAGDSVATVFEDSQNQIWVSTSTGGVAKIAGDSLVYPFLYEPLNYQKVLSITEPSKGEYWFGTASKGIFIYHDGKDQIEQLTVEDGLPSNRINHLLVGREGTVWMATDRGLASYRNEQVNTYPSASVPIRSLFLDNSQMLWLATEQGLYKVEKGVSHNMLFEGGDLGSIIDITQDRSGNILIAAEEVGVFQLSENQLHPLILSNWVSPQDIRGFYRDAQDHIWLYMKGEGALLIRNESFVRYNTSSTQPTARDQFLDVQVNGPAGRTWFATSEGLQYWDGNKRAVLSLEDTPFKNETVQSIAKFPNNDLLLVTHALTLYRFNGEQFNVLTTQSRFLQESASRVFTLSINSKGDIYAGSDQGLIAFTNQTARLYSHSDGLPSNFVWHIMEDDANRLWISTNEGVITLGEDGEIRQVDALKTLGFNKFFRYTIQDSNGNYWLGTNEGIIWYKPGSGTAEGTGELRLINNHDGLLSIDTQFLSIDSSNHLWHGTTAGLHRINLSQFYEEGTVTPVHFSLSDQGLGIAFQRGAVGESEDGNLWFGSDKGVVLHNLNAGSLSNGSPDIRITNVEVSYNEQDQIKRYNTTVKEDSISQTITRLAHYENNLSFNFMALDFESPENIKYRYILEGYENSWSDLGTGKKVNYSNIPPGSYTFRVEAKDGHGIWSEQAAAFDFSISYPFWQSNKFYGILILLFVGVVFGGMKIWLNTYEKRKLEALVNSQTQDLREGLREKEVLLAEIHHRVKNNLAVISGLIELQKNSVSDPEAVRSMQETQSRIKSIAMIHEKLYGADSYTDIRFQNYVEELVDIIADSYNLKGKKIKTHVDAGDVTVPLDQSIPCGLILNELLSNAYEHAFTGRDSGNIYVKLKEDKGHVRLIVKDDGVGMAEDNEKQSGSLGMTLVKILTQQLAGDLSTRNHVGTTFIITFKRMNQSKGHLE